MARGWQSTSSEANHLEINVRCVKENALAIYVSWNKLLMNSHINAIKRKCCLICVNLELTMVSKQQSLYVVRYLVEIIEMSKSRSYRKRTIAALLGFKFPNRRVTR